ncbi:hypothetical protein F8S13_03665 [Chloroflexia bacterium SDU3-3]|nr:hypothetical protein F8S13_03665 [Chloroflexia bacterium SDU3-3]
MADISSIEKSVRELLTRMCRIWHPIAGRLRRRGALTSLFVVLTLGLLEPLACVAHCAIIEMLGTASGMTAMHHHHASATPDLASVAPVGTNCHGMASSPNSAAPNCPTSFGQPFHEMLLLSVVILLVLASIARPNLSPVLRQAQHRPQPLSPPPIIRPAFAA